MSERLLQRLGDACKGMSETWASFLPSESPGRGCSCSDFLNSLAALSYCPLASRLCARSRHRSASSWLDTSMLRLESGGEEGRLHGLARLRLLVTDEDREPSHRSSLIALLGELL